MRQCDHCGKEIKEGFCIEGGSEYYCCVQCLCQHHTWHEYLELYDNGEGDSYWTEWND